MAPPLIRKSISFDDPLGISADLQTKLCAAAGFLPVCHPPSPGAVPKFSRLDPGEFLIPNVAGFSAEMLDEGVAALGEDGVFPETDWIDGYLERDFVLSPGRVLAFTHEALARAAIRYGWALARASELAAAAPVAEGELVLDKADASITPLEHLFIALEVQRRALPISALALRWPWVFEPAHDFEGDATEFAEHLATHLAIARFTGPGKLSIPHVEEKFAVLPLLGSLGGENLHLQTTGLSWRAALRVVARQAPGLFRNLLRCAQEHFVFDQNGGPLSITEEDIRFLPDVTNEALEATFLGDVRGRQLLQVTAGSILAEPTLGEPLQAFLAQHAAAHMDLLGTDWEKHLAALRSPIP